MDERSRSPSTITRRRGRSPSKRRISSIDKKDGELSLNPDEIDDLITNWHDTKADIKELEVKEKRYKLLIHKLLDVTGSDAIKGKDLQVTRNSYKKILISKQMLPEDIFEKYSEEREIVCLRVKNISR
jgi:regulator of sirC expression with transglutaminase-like and TPR domain